MGREKEFENTTSEFGFRKYDEETGSFLQPDPLWALFPSQSPYQYGYNSPLNFSDASGLFNETPLTGSPTVSVCQGCGADGVTGGCVCGGGGGTGGGGTSGGGTGGIGINPYFEAIAAANQASREAGWASASREFFAADNLALAASAGRIPGGSGGGNANNNDTGQRGSTPNDVVSMLDGQNRTQTQTPNLGSGEYGGRVRSDGSVWFSKSHKAFRYMYNVQKNGREAFGVIFKNGVLVLPTHKNTASSSMPARYGYSLRNGVLSDPIHQFSTRVLSKVKLF